MKKLRWLSLFLLVGETVLALPAGEPTIELSLSKSNFAAPFGGPDPAPGTLTIKNIGQGKMTWSAAELAPAAWLSLSQTSSTGTGLNPNASDVVDVLVDVTGVAAGDYQCTIRITSAGATNTPQDVVVNLHVSLKPHIDLTPGSLSFAAPQNGQNPAAKPLTLRNTGGEDLHWTATPQQTWITINKDEGTLGAALSENISVSVNVTGLLANTYNGSIKFESPDADNSPVFVDVTLVVSQKPSIGLAPTTLTFDTAPGVPPGSKNVTISNVGGGTLNWLASSDVGWLTLNPERDSLGSSASQIMTVSVNGTAPTTAGSYPATITVLDEFDATIPANTVAVTLNVNAGPKIGLNPTTLSFSVTVDSGSSSPKAVSVTNTGALLLEWASTGGAAWLKSSPASGSLTALDSEPLLLSVKPTGLAPGVYSTTLQIEDPDASNSPRTISVEMTVKESSLPTSAPAGQCGLLGLEMVAVLLLMRIRMSRGGRS